MTKKNPSGSRTVKTQLFSDQSWVVLRNSDQFSRTLRCPHGRPLGTELCRLSLVGVGDPRVAHLQNRSRAEVVVLLLHRCCSAAPAQLSSQEWQPPNASDPMQEILHTSFSPLVLNKWLVFSSCLEVFLPKKKKNHFSSTSCCYIHVLVCVFDEKKA